MGEDSDCIHTLIHFRPQRSNTSLSPPTAFPFPAWLLCCLADEPCCPAWWWLSCLSVYFQAQGPVPRQAVSQAVWWRAEGLMRVSERRSPTFPRRLAAGRACRGGFASFSRPLRFLRSSGSYSFPARKQPSPATSGGGGCKGMGGGFGFKMSPGLGTASPGLKS